MRVLVFTNFFEPGYAGGGPIRSISQIIDTVTSEIDVAVLTSSRDLGSRVTYPGLRNATIVRGRAHVTYCDLRRLSGFKLAWNVCRDGQWDVVYLNSFFNLLFAAVPLIGTRVGLIRARMILIAPRGEFSPGALSIHRRRKRIFQFIFRAILSDRRIEWHASSYTEATDIAREVWQAVIHESGDPTALPDRSVSNYSPERCPRFVHISRITPKKNLLAALRAFKALTAEARFDIYGPVEDQRYWAQCLRVIDEMPQHLTVTYRGHLAPADVLPTFARYDVFIFPTLGENFGHVIAESLAASCPVICTASTPWSDALSDGGGQLVALGDGSLAAAIERYATLTPEERDVSRRLAAAAFERWQMSRDRSHIFELVQRSRGPHDS